MFHLHYISIATVVGIKFLQSLCTHMTPVTVLSTLHLSPCVLIHHCTLCSVGGLASFRHTIQKPSVIRVLMSLNWISEWI